MKRTIFSYLRSVWYYRVVDFVDMAIGKKMTNSPTPWLMEHGGSMPYSQRFSNNPYPEPNQDEENQCYTPCRVIFCHHNMCMILRPHTDDGLLSSTLYNTT